MTLAWLPVPRYSECDTLESQPWLVAPSLVRAEVWWGACHQFLLLSCLSMGLIPQAPY